MGRRRRRSLDSRRVATGSYALLATWALVSAAAGHLVLGLASAVLFGVLAVVCLRLTRAGGLAPCLAGDPEAELARLRGLLEPLCARSGCAVPEVRVVGFAAGAANARVTRRGDEWWRRRGPIRRPRSALPPSGLSRRPADPSGRAGR